jgi:hypothetical protein
MLIFEWKRRFFDHGFHGWARMEEPGQFILIRENPRNPWFKFFMV